MSHSNYYFFFNSRLSSRVKKQPTYHLGIRNVVITFARESFWSLFLIADVGLLIPNAFIYEFDTVLKQETISDK